MRRFVFALLLVSFVSDTSAQEVTGLSGWDIFLDPGHSQTENQGVFGYSEAHKNLEVGLALRELLLMTTDIDTVWMSRTNHFVEVSLSQRVDFANQLGASNFHSIHSNAAAPSANSVLILWPQYTDGTEAVPNGGKRMSEIMNDILSDAMRIPAAGAIGECDFYGYASCRGRDLGTGKGGSRNFVQSFTNMASELSEAGFHTNPTQNQRNMNADWKRLEAQAFYWSVLEYHEIERPPVGILAGIVSNIETGQPINGATISVLDTSYVTDTFESLFHNYSNDPDQLHNGFYYLDDLPPGSTVDVTVEAEGYATEVITSVVLVDSFFTFLDVELISQIPPVVESSSPEADEPAFRHVDPIVVDFSRQMDPASVEAAFSISPDPGGTFSWTDSNTRMIFRPDTLLPVTAYTFRIEDTAQGAYGHGFDGDADGEAGGAYEVSFTSSQTDVFAPVLVDGYPRPRERDVSVRPVITYTYDEPLDSASVASERFVLQPSTGGPAVDGQLTYDVVGESSIVTFFPDADLEMGTSYTFDIQSGLSDISGNVIEDTRSFQFTTTASTYEFTSIDPFEPTPAGTWWEPQQSGSTAGIVTDSTSFGRDDTRAVLSNGSTQSQRLTYGWDTEAGSPLIRAYLASGAARSITFDTDETLQVYLYGDGSGTQFRFALDDAEGHEVSPWYTIDWYGWRLVEWDLSEGELGTWLGDGSLDEPLNIDSFQFTYGGDEAAQFGTLWLDDLRLAREIDDTPIEGDPTVPAQFALHANYPNPFNPSTAIRFSLPNRVPVTLIVYNALGQQVDVLLQQEMLGADTHEIMWDAGQLPSGVYIARLITSEHQASRKLILAK